MRKFFAVAALTAALAMTETAEAADKGIYLGAAVGRSTSDLNVRDIFPLDDDDTAFKLIGGLRPLNWLGVEASYRHLGTVGRHDDYRVKLRGVDAFAVFFREIAVFDLFAKAGVVRWDLDGTRQAAHYHVGEPSQVSRIDVSDNGTNFAWGVGAQARLLSLAVRLEYERFELDSSKGLLEKPRMLSLGVTWTFF